jgi:hypothetical protein
VTVLLVSRRESQPAKMGSRVGRGGRQKDDITKTPLYIHVR